MRTIDEFIAARGVHPKAHPIHIEGYGLPYWSEEEGMADISMSRDGTIDNPNGYPEEDVRTALRNLVGRYLQAVSDRAKKAAETRKRRVEKKVYEVAQRILDGKPGLSGRKSCYVCGKGFSDQKSIGRGVGPECWSHVLARIELIKNRTLI